jgi:hypothetical protein
MKVRWILVGPPCEGIYEAESTWPPPRRIRAVHGGGLLGDGPPAVLDLPGDEPEPGEQLVEYEIETHGFVCGRARGQGAGAFGLYVRAGLADEAKMKLFRRAAAGLELA